MLVGVGAGVGVGVGFGVSVVDGVGAGVSVGVGVEVSVGVGIWHHRRRFDLNTSGVVEQGEVLGPYYGLGGLTLLGLDPFRAPYTKLK